MFLREDDDRAAFGSFVGERRKLRGVREVSFLHSGGWNKFGGAAIAEGDRAGFVEQKRVDVARGFDGAAGHGEDVALHDAVHARDADGGEQTADGGRNQANQQRDQHENRLRRAGIDRHGLKRDDGQQENDREPCEQNVERDFVGSFLALGAFDELDHAIEEGLAGIRRDHDDDFVGKHARAAGDGRTVAAGFANHWRGFTGDGRFVDRGDAFDDFAVSGDEFAGDDFYLVTRSELRAGNFLSRAIGAQAMRDRFRAGFAQRVGLSLAAALGHGFGKIREEHGEPEPQSDLELESVARLVKGMVPDQVERGDHRADFDDEHHGVFHQRAGIQLDERVPDCAGDDAAGPE